MISGLDGGMFSAKCHSNNLVLIIGTSDSALMLTMSALQMLVLLLLFTFVSFYFAVNRVLQDCVTDKFPCNICYTVSVCQWLCVLSDNHDIISMKLYDINVGHKVELLNIF